MKPPNPSNDNREKEFIEAYDKYADDIYRHCYFRVYNEALAQDITQETFIKTWKYMTEGKEVKNIRSFLYKVAVNLIIDNSRKKKTVTLDDATERGMLVRPHTEELDMLSKMEYKEVLALIHSLDDNYREVLIMRHVDGLMPAQIAEILQESPNAVSVRINQGIKKLRKVIDEKYHFQED